jgi:hypothetical protein
VLLPIFGASRGPHAFLPHRPAGAYQLICHSAATVASIRPALVTGQYNLTIYGRQSAYAKQFPPKLAAPASRGRVLFAHPREPEDRSGEVYSFSWYKGGHSRPPGAAHARAEASIRRFDQICLATNGGGGVPRRSSCFDQPGKPQQARPRAAAPATGERRSRHGFGGPPGRRCARSFTRSSPPPTRHVGTRFHARWASAVLHYEVSSPRRRQGPLPLIG